MLIVGFDGLFEIVGANFVCEVCDYGYRLIDFRFIKYYCPLLSLREISFGQYTFVKVDGYCTHEHTIYYLKQDTEVASRCCVCPTNIPYTILNQGLQKCIIAETR